MSGSLAFWTDLGADTLGDIAGADLTWGDPFEVAVGDGAQTDVAAGADGGFAAWLDASGAAPVVRGGWVEWVEGDDGGEEPGPVPQWTTEDVVTLFLGVLSELDVFDEVRFAVDDAEYGEWQSLEDTEAVKLPSGGRRARDPHPAGQLRLRRRSAGQRGPGRSRSASRRRWTRTVR